VSARSRFLAEFPRAIADDAAAVFIGAGVSASAGYPSWKDLLRDIGDELGVSSDDVHDLAALAQWSVGRTSSRTRVNNVIRAEIAPDRPIPPSLGTIARLPIRNIWTTNYDRLIERAFAEIGRPIDPISAAADLALKPRPGAARLFKMHGSVDRLDDIVIATDDYELYRLKRGAFLPLLQAHMTSLSMLFMGLSFTDPNVRHVLSLIRESFAASPPEHFAIVRPPQRCDYKTAKEYKARLTQHKLWAEDLLRYGLQVVEIERYEEVAELLREVERRVASNRVWISGSWPLTGGSPDDLAYVAAVAAALGRELGQHDFVLVSGAGLTVGSASISGFLGALQRKGSWDLERRLIARPFPQPVEGQVPNREQWAALRAEMARIAGAIVFVGGAKIEGGNIVAANGVRAELEAALAAGAFLVPIGSTGGMAKLIAEELLDARGSGRQLAPRPSKQDLRTLMRPGEPEAMAKKVISLLVRHGRGN
jgi:hypothetical protein